MRKLMLKVVPLAVTGLLVACGNSSKNAEMSSALSVERPDAAEEAARTFATSDTDVVGKVLEDGATLAARSLAVAGQTLNYSDDGPDAGKTGLVSGTTATISKNADGELTAVINGKTYAFTSDQRKIEVDGDIYGYSVSDDENSVYYSLFSHAGEIDELLDEAGDRFAVPINFQTNQEFEGGEPNLKVWAVLGAETPDDVVAAMPTATYSGRMRMDIAPNEGWENHGTSRTTLRGDDVNLVANFGAGTVSGSVTGLRTRDPGESDYETLNGAIVLNEGDIVANGFGGTMTPNAALSDDINGGFSGNYSGAFYGPAADEASGVMTVTGTNEDGQGYNAAGYFVTDKVE